jgi:thiol:disulfide interchange protein DsbC
VRRHELVLLAAALALAPAAQAAEVPAAVTQAVEKMARMTPDYVGPSLVQGLYELRVGTQIVYISADGKHAVVGSIVELETAKNLTEETRKVARQKALAAIDPADTITFAPENPRHTVYVFTDPRCNYCRKFHSEVPELNALGIAVRYLAFPILTAESEPEAVSVWCADDRKAALTAAKTDQPVEPRTCDNPVEEQRKLALLLGAGGTPAIFLEDGELLPGYLPAKELAQRLEPEPQQSPVAAVPAPAPAP